jgi:hypothetical protein
MLEKVDLYQPIIDFLAEKPFDCVGEKKEAWVILAKLTKHPKHRNTKTVQYFKKHIYPSVKKFLGQFEQEISTIQTVPQELPREIEKIVYNSLL